MGKKRAGVFDEAMFGYGYGRETKRLLQNWIQGEQLRFGTLLQGFPGDIHDAEIKITLGSYHFKCSSSQIDMSLYIHEKRTSIQEDFVIYSLNGPLLNSQAAHLSTMRTITERCLSFLLVIFTHW